VVHEWLLDSALRSFDAMTVTDGLLSAVEMIAVEDRVTCVTFLLRNAVIIEPFERRGYASLALGSTSVWLQRKLGWVGWSGGGSGPQ
jgi:hypothetical protein